MTRLSLALVLALASAALAGEMGVSVNPEPANYAWWLRIEFTPGPDAIRGIRADSIRPDWLKASELKKEHIPKDLLYEAGVDGMDRAGLVFSRYGDFNKDGVRDLALVGVYQSKSVGKGNFLLILSLTKPQTWQTSYLRTWQQTPGFLALAKGSRNVEVWWCMECDDVSTLRWNHGAGEYQWVDYGELP